MTDPYLSIAATLICIAIPLALAVLPAMACRSRQARADAARRRYLLRCNPGEPVGMDYDDGEVLAGAKREYWRIIDS